MCPQSQGPGTNTVVVIPDRSVEKPVFMILRDQNEGNLDKQWFYVTPVELQVLWYM